MRLKPNPKSILMIKVKAINKRGGRLRIYANIQFGEQRYIGGIDKREFFLSGKDDRGRSVKAAGSVKFLGSLL